MDPRITRTQQAVVAAATELLVEGGPDALTVDGIVARSGVAKSTIYRHWKTRDDLVVEVFSSCAPHIDMPPEGLPFEDALRDLARRLVATLSDERWRRLVPALLLLKLQDPDLARVNDQLESEQSRVFTRVIRQGVEEGVLAPEVLDDMERHMTLLVGPIVMAALMGTIDADTPLADEAVEQFLARRRQR